MAKFESYMALLNDYEANPGGWSDDGVLRAEEILQTFQASDWDRLEVEWEGQPEWWQGFCAYSINDASPKHAIAILLNMIRRGAMTVKVGACDSLRVLLEGRAEKLQVDEGILATIEVLASRADGIWAGSIQELRRRVSFAHSDATHQPAVLPENRH